MLVLQAGGQLRPLKPTKVPLITISAAVVQARSAVGRLGIRVMQ